MSCSSPAIKSSFSGDGFPLKPSHKLRKSKSKQLEDSNHLETEFSQMMNTIDKELDALSGGLQRVSDVTKFEVAREMTQIVCKSASVKKSAVKGNAKMSGDDIMFQKEVKKLHKSFLQELRMASKSETKTTFIKKLQKRVSSSDVFYDVIDDEVGKTSLDGSKKRRRAGPKFCYISQKKYRLLCLWLLARKYNSSSPGKSFSLPSITLGFSAQNSLQSSPHSSLAPTKGCALSNSSFNSTKSTSASNLTVPFPKLTLSASNNFSFSVPASSKSLTFAFGDPTSYKASPTNCAGCKTLESSANDDTAARKSRGILETTKAHTKSTFSFNYPESSEAPTSASLALAMTSSATTSKTPTVCETFNFTCFSPKTNDNSMFIFDDSAAFQKSTLPLAASKTCQIPRLTFSTPKTTVFTTNAIKKCDSLKAMPCSSQIVKNSQFTSNVLDFSHSTLTTSVHSESSDSAKLSRLSLESSTSGIEKASVNSATVCTTENFQMSTSVVSNSTLQSAETSASSSCASVSVSSGFVNPHSNRDISLKPPSIGLTSLSTIAGSNFAPENSANSSVPTYPSSPATVASRLNCTVSTLPDCTLETPNTTADIPDFPVLPFSLTSPKVSTPAVAPCAVISDAISIGKDVSAPNDEVLKPVDHQTTSHIEIQEKPLIVHYSTEKESGVDKMEGLISASPSDDGSVVTASTSSVDPCSQITRKNQIGDYMSSSVDPRSYVVPFTPKVLWSLGQSGEGKDVLSLLSSKLSPDSSLTKSQSVTTITRWQDSTKSHSVDSPSMIKNEPMMQTKKPLSMTVKNLASSNHLLSPAKIQGFENRAQSDSEAMAVNSNPVLQVDVPDPSGDTFEPKKLPVPNPAPGTRNAIPIFAESLASNFLTPVTMPRPNFSAPTTTVPQVQLRSQQLSNFHSMPTQITFGVQPPSTAAATPATLSSETSVMHEDAVTSRRQLASASNLFDRNLFAASSTQPTAGFGTQPVFSTPAARLEPTSLFNQNARSSHTVSTSSDIQHSSSSGFSGFASSNTVGFDSLAATASTTKNKPLSSKKRDEGEKDNDKKQSSFSKWR